MSDSFLTAEDKAIVEEIKLVQKIMADAETAYAAWERWCLTAMVALMSAVVLLFNSNPNSWLPTCLSIVALVFTFLFWQMQIANNLFANARTERWRALENALSKKS